MEKKKKETNDVYENIANSLDTSFDGEEVKELVEVKAQADKCKDLVEVNVNEIDETKLEDEDYIRSEAKSLVDNIEVAMTKLQQDIQIGTPARKIEVFSQLCNAKGNILRDIINMNKIKLDAKIKLQKKDVPRNMTVNQNVHLTSSEMLKMVNGAKKNNSLKNIEAKFDIKSEKNLE